MKKALSAKEQALMLQFDLHAIALETGISHYKIARDTGILQPNVNRMLVGRSVIKLDSFIKICSALGYEITLTKK